jgi:hypothetical protein
MSADQLKTGGGNGSCKLLFHFVLRRPALLVCRHAQVAARYELHLVFL